jgi:hypothetical protein
MKDLVNEWLSSAKEQITLVEGDDEVSLTRQGGAVLLSAQLTSARPDSTTLQNWLRLGAASLTHFQGTVAQQADTGALWLIQISKAGDGQAHLLGCLEALLNQRDTWRAIDARLARPPQQVKPTSLRSLSY